MAKCISCSSKGTDGVLPRQLIMMERRQVTASLGNGTSPCASTEQCREVSEQSCCSPTTGCTPACYLNSGLWNLGIRIRNGAYTTFLGNVEYGAAHWWWPWEYGELQESLWTSCRGLRDVPTFPIFGVHWQIGLFITPEARHASMPMLPLHLAILLVFVGSSSLLWAVLVCESHTLSHTLAY